MNNHTLRVLEYEAMLERLAYHCNSVPGKRKASSLRPRTDIESIEYQFDLISEMNDLFEVHGGPPGLSFDDLSLRLDQAKSAGEILDPKELLKYSSFFAIVNECQRLREQYTKLNEILAELVYPEDLHKEIEKSVDIDGSIKNSASSELYTIRKELGKIKIKLNIKFEKYLNSNMVSYLSDKLFTVREGRYVLPVRETDKGQVKGIIHDRSSSGATFFIEPSETVELNNCHRELETAEREEINRILRRLSEMLYIIRDMVKDDIDLLSRLDFIAGCSRLARELKANRPIFPDKAEISIKNGRHPILVLNSSQSGSEVVPLSVTMKTGSKVLIITGPNTGGKTVALKTVGLLSLMGSSGLYVPADEGSSFVLFEKIFADIGDEQSIDSSLSTYSSHLSHIKTALDESGRGSLVLFDELGAGTDPDEGSAIGQAVVEYLSDKGCYAVITTHHGRLKALAGKVDGVVNGSMEFDTANLSPTFRFLPEIPGSSYAVEIAKRLGLCDEVTERALKLLDRGESDITGLITDLHQKSVELSKELDTIQSEREKYESLKTELEEKLQNQRKSEKQYRRDQLKKTEELIERTRDELESLMEKARTKRSDMEALRSFRREVKGKLSRTREQIKEMTPKPSGEPARGLPGEDVYVVGVEAEGEVLEPADSTGRVKVRVGNVTMVTDLEKLIKKRASKKRALKTETRTDYAPEPGMELDIRGTTFEEAEPLIEKYLDDVTIAGLKQVTIIHGKGTGALRRKVQDYLSKNHRIESHRLGNWNEGSSGVSIVTLKANE